MTQRQVEVTGYFSTFEFQFDKDMTVRLDKEGINIKLSLTEPTSALTQQEVKTLLSFVKLAVDMLLPL